MNIKLDQTLVGAAAQDVCLFGVSADNDADGYSSLDGDCDDHNAEIHIGASELCDGIDNSCDGTIDEGFEEKGNPCTVDVGACAGFAVFVCSDDRRSLICPAVSGLPSEEICDWIDNDCDGEVDDDITRVCGSDIGTCTTGMQSCVFGEWGACTGEITSIPEICDGLDNDCDEVIDNGVMNACGVCGAG